MRSGGRRALRPGPLLAVAAVVAALAVTGHALRARLPVVSALEHRAEDALFRLRGPAPPTSDILLVLVDDASLAGLGRWPPSRAVLARAVDRLAEAGASVVVLDLLLDAPEPAGEADAALEAAMRRAGNVVLPFGFVDRADASNAFEPPPALRRAAFAVVREPADGRANVSHPAGLLLPLGRFLEAAHPAHATLRPDADGTLRSFPLAVRFGEAWYTSVPLEAARLHLALAADELVLEPGRRLRLGGREVPLGPGNLFRPDWRGPAGSFETVPFAELLAGSVAPGRIAGRVVFLGVAATGLGDRHLAPFGPGLPGVEVLATVTDGLLAGRSVRTSPTIDRAAILFASMLAVLLVRIRRAAAAWNVVLFAAVGWWAGVGAAFSSAGIVPDPVFPVLALACGTLAARGLDRRRRGAYGVASPVPAAVLFTDLAGSTALSERLGGPATAELLRRLHATIETCVVRRGGEIVEWTGDGAFAVFGLSGEGPQAAVAALACGRDLLQALATAPAGGTSGLSCRVGIHFGPVTPARLGGPTSARASIVGDTVNVASRLEQLNKAFGSRIAVSDAVVEAVRACGEGRLLGGFEPQPPQELRGRERPVGVWTLR